MAHVLAERVKETTTTTGTGTVTLAGAVTGFQSFAAIGNANTTDYMLLDANGTGWERGLGTYTSSGTTLARTTVYASSNSGSAITLSSGTHTVFCDFAAHRGQSLYNGMLTYITGLLVTKHTGANSLDISAGACYDPSSGKIISYAGGSAVSAGSLGASQWNQVYLYDNAGTPTIQVINNADPTSTCYAGTARQGGTTVTNKRWIGYFKTDGSSNIIDLVPIESAQGQLLVTAPAIAVNAAPFRIVSAGTATTYGSETSAAGIVPRYAVSEALINYNMTYTGSAASALSCYFSLDGTNTNCGTVGAYIDAANNLHNGTVWLPLEKSTPGIYYKLVVGSGTSPNVYLDVHAHKAQR